MANRTPNQIKLGIFVTAGIAFLVLLLYSIGKNHHLFGNTFEIKARFKNARGLMPGNNIRFSGIDAGTVKEVKIINDSTIEAVLLVKADMKSHISKNAVAYISTDGIMGNKLVNIEPSEKTGLPIEEGDIIYGKKGADTDEMLSVLSNTNNDLAIIASSLKSTISRFNASQSLWTILEDSTLPVYVRQSMRQFRDATVKMDHMMENLTLASEDIAAGRGTIGQLIKDSSIAHSLKESIEEIRRVGQSADSISKSVQKLIDTVQSDIVHSRGIAGSALRDTAISNSFSATMENLEKGTRAFNENMEALRNNFLFRGYFKKQEQKKKNRP